MFSQTTRLEFAIVAVALLLLLFCSRPPQSGNADPRPEANYAADSQPVEIPPAGSENTEPTEEFQPAAAKPSPDPIKVALPVKMPTPTETEADTERIGVVDARNCAGLDYKKVMKGKVTVRYVWDGNRMVAKRVCVVEGDNGVSTVWSFDQQNEAVLSERKE